MTGGCRLVTMEDDRSLRSGAAVVPGEPELDRRVASRAVDLFVSPAEEVACPTPPGRTRSAGWLDLRKLSPSAPERRRTPLRVHDPRRRLARQRC